MDVEKAADGSSSAPILAQYSVRSKQSYIFKTNQLLEIVGASEIISMAFKKLFELAETCVTPDGRLVRTGRFADSPSDWAELVDRLTADRADGLDMLELFEGGGNDTVLFRNHDVFRLVNACYTRWILENCPGMVPLCVGVEADLSADDYKADYARLRQAADREKKRMIPGRSGAAVPFAKMDRSIFQPYSATDLVGKEREIKELSDESSRKRKVGKEKSKGQIQELDDMTEASNSLLAIVHADGNSMGRKIGRKLEGHSDYASCVGVMSRFTREIDDAFQAGWKRLEARRQELLETYPNRNPKTFEIREIVNGGDDATFICNARYALTLTRAYLEGVSAYSSDERYSSCAGICIFHSHYPCARAYELAEQACKNAKKPVHEREDVEQGWLDFHYIRSGVGGDLEEIRALQGLEGRMMRPLYVCGDEPPTPEQRLETLDALSRTLSKYGVSRGNVKTLGDAWETDAAQSKLEWNRVRYHTKDVDGASLESELDKLFPGPESLLRALYDIADIYDLWYRKEGGAV